MSAARLAGRRPGGRRRGSRRARAGAWPRATTAPAPARARQRPRQGEAATTPASTAGGGAVGGARAAVGAARWLRSVPAATWIHGVILMAVSSAGCLQDHAPASDAAATQLAAGVGIEHVSFWNDGLLFTRAATAGCGPGLWRVSLAGGEAQALVPALSRAFTPAFFLRGDRLWAWADDCDGRGAALRVFDDAGSPAGEARLPSGPLRVSRDGTVVAAQAAAGGAVVYGSPGAVAEVPLPEGQETLPGAFALMGDDLVMAVAAPGGAGASLLKVDAATRAVTTLVPASFAAGELSSDGIEAACRGAACAGLLALGCGASAPPCSATQPARCLLAYTRTVSDARQSPPDQARRTVVWDAATGEESVLAIDPSRGLAPADDEGFFVSPDEHELIWRDPTPLEGGDRRIRTLSACLGRDDKCRVAGGPQLSLSFRPDNAAFAVALNDPGNLQIVRLDTMECHTPAISQRLGAPSWAAGSGALALFERSGSPQGVWVTDGLGNGPTKVAEDAALVPPLALSGDGRHLFLGRSAADGRVSLGVVDLGSRDHPERPLTEAHGQLLVGSRRALATASWQTEPRIGALTLFDVTAASAVVLDEQVASFAVRGDVDRAAPAAYVVHGRYPSARDGLWIVTLPK